MIAQAINKLKEALATLGETTTLDIMQHIEQVSTTFANLTQADVDSWETNLDTPISGLGGATKKVVSLTSGTSWTHPADLNTDKIIYLSGYAAGGGGGTSDLNGYGGGGGGGGEYITYPIRIQLTGSSTAYTVGAAGTGGASGDGVFVCRANGVRVNPSRRSASLAASMSGTQCARWSK